MPYTLSGSSTYLRVVFERCKCDDPALPVEDRYCQIRGLDQFEDLGVRVDAVVDVVLSNLNQVNNLIAVVRVSPTENDALKVELVSLQLLLVIDFNVCFHVSSFTLSFFCNALNIINLLQINYL